MSEPEFWSDLVGRGIVQQTTSPELGKWLGDRIAAGNPVRLYAGFDPTADSLHVGSLMPVLGLKRFRNAGMTPIAVVGGATGMIGDPSGKAAERVLMNAEILARNTQALATQLETLLEGEVGKDFLLVDNAEWIGPVTLVEFLRDVGKHFSVNMMVAKDSVKSRLEQREQGISFTEFSYMLLQAYDFLHLYENYGCRLQVGGTDQWGNITAGIDLIRHKHHGAEAHGCTFPLITTASGQKFGKSEQGTIWIDRNKTHPYFLYKYFFHTDDADVIRFLKYFTFVPLEEIAGIAEEMTAAPEKRSAQRRLAFEATTIVHGRDTAAACEGLEAAMHQDDVEAFEKHADTLGLLDPASLGEGHDQTLLPVSHRPITSLSGEGIPILDLAVEIGLFKSKSEVRREIQSKQSGFRVGGQPVADVEFRVTSETLAGRRVLSISKGKRNKRMVCFHS